VEWEPNRKALLELLAGSVSTGDVVLTLGAGDITGVGRALLARLTGAAA
jgi:UDP-N-acetylmuramate-alanine ligase